MPCATARKKKKHTAGGIITVHAAYLVCVGAHRDAECTRQPKVCKLELVVLPVYEQVLGLQITVQNPAGNDRGKHTRQQQQQQQRRGTYNRMRTFVVQWF
jgi:hypothetical protein